MIFHSLHGNKDSDIFTSREGYELIRTVLGFDIQRVSIIYQGVKVHQVEAQEGLNRAMDWCQEHARLQQAIPETTFSEHCEQQR